MTQYRWGCEKPGGLTLVSPIFEDYDACYEDYCKNMEALSERGLKLDTLLWRGVYNLEQIALILLGKSIYTDKITVQEDV